MRAITVDAVSGRLGKADNERITQAGNEVRRISEEADFTLAKFAVIASQINGLVKT